MASQSQPVLPETGIVGSEPSASWRCFHCDEVFTDRQCAQDHFGLDECELPGCVAILKEGERAILEDRRMWRERAFQEERDHEKTGQELSSLRWEVRAITRKSGQELRHVWDDMESRMLANEASLQAAPKWLRTFLMWRSERLWRKSRAGRAALSRAQGASDGPQGQDGQHKTNTLSSRLPEQGR